MARRPDGAKRAKIIEAARTTFGENGYRRTTVKQIAAAAGIAPGTLYTYFANKEDLFSEAVGEIWRRFITGMQSISVGRGAFLEKLVAFIDFGFDLIEEIHPLLRGMFSEANRRELLIERVEEVCEFIGGFFDDSLSKGVLFGSTSNEELRRFNLRMIVSGILFRAALAPPNALRAEFESIRRGLVLGINERMSVRGRS